MTSKSNNLVQIALIASVVVGISPAILHGLAWLVISPAVIPLVFTANFALIILGNKLISKFIIRPVPQLFLVIPMGLIGALEALLLIVESISWYIESNVLIEYVYFYGSIGFIAAITSWFLYNFWPLKIAMYHSNKAPAVGRGEAAPLSAVVRSPVNSSVWKKIIQSFALLSFFANVGIVIFICILSVQGLTHLGEAFSKPGNLLTVPLGMFVLISGATVAGGLFIICAIVSGLTCIKIESAHNSGLVLRSFTLFVFMVPAMFVTYYFGPKVW